MKSGILKKVTAMTLASAMALTSLTACSGGSDPGSDTSAPAQSGDSQDASEAAQDGSEAADAGTSGGTDGGTIMWLSNLSSGAQYEAALAYGEAVANAFGFDFAVVYADSFNDPNGNLTAVQNGMTSDIVGIVASQDGGIQNILDEYPDLYVAGYNTDMNAIYGNEESGGGTAAAVMDYENFLGTIADGYYDGAKAGEQYAQAVIDKGYKRVAVIGFPSYAYPTTPVADAAFRETIEEYNQTADEPIEVVGDMKVLEFAPLEESWFLEEGNSDLDAIVAICAGTTFVYPTMKSAQANGTCSADTKLITSGFDSEESIMDDIGDDKAISYLSISPVEDIGYAVALVAKAVKGELYSDYTANERIESIQFTIDSAEDIAAVREKSLLCTVDVNNALITPQEWVDVASYADLKALIQSDQSSMDALLNK
ncbi:MAG TPA: hypothetical protein IAB46_09600 [Candidatus Scybalocola faecigallinarum]|uniref:Sugar ABC transporter substrate-binding protein n=1 Tax=Candidatus Scybalocola faecigallinarum TaxID=2840941 RepID=A0A9D1F5K0_9FIRM|nr:hypothetical protein [Candidatus Scybalocola faecigallinarum]